MNRLQSSLEERLKVIQAELVSKLNAQDTEIALIFAKTQVDIDAAENDIVHYRQTIAGKREPRVAGGCSVAAGRAQVEELQRELEELEYNLSVITSPILALSDDVMAEIFDWDTTIGGN